MKLTDAIAFLLEFGVSNLSYPEEHLEIKKKLYIPKANDSIKQLSISTIKIITMIILQT